jgi:hypothetical protein
MNIQEFPLRSERVSSRHKASYIVPARRAPLFILAEQSAGDAHGMFRELLFST